MSFVREHHKFNLTAHSHNNKVFSPTLLSGSVKHLDVFELYTDACPQSY